MLLAAAIFLFFNFIFKVNVLVNFIGVLSNGIHTSCVPSLVTEATRTAETAYQR